MSSTNNSNVPVAVVGNEKIAAFAEKLNRPLEELIKESKKQNKQNKHNKQNRQHQQNQKNKKVQNKPNRPPAGSPLKPDQVRVTIKNDFAARPRAPRVPSPRIMRRMEDVTYTTRPSRIDYGRPVSSSRYVPPPSRQPRIRKP